MRAETQSHCSGDGCASELLEAAGAERQVWKAQSYLRSLDFVLCAVEIVNIVVGQWPDGSRLCVAAHMLPVCTWKLTEKHFAQTSQMVKLMPVISYLKFCSPGKATEEQINS